MRIDEATIEKIDKIFKRTNTMQIIALEIDKGIQLDEHSK